MRVSDKVRHTAKREEETRQDRRLAASVPSYVGAASVSRCPSGVPIDTEFCRQVAAELPFLRRLVRRWQRDAASAEDLVQDTVVQALANQHMWQRGSNLRAWLVTIMRNQFLAALAKTRRSHLLLEMFAANDAEWASDPREARLMLRDVERALWRLPNKQRSAILWIGVEGKSYEEAARMMDVSVCAVRCHLARGRDRLRMAVYTGGEGSPLGSRAGRHPAFAAPPASYIQSAEPVGQGAD